MIYLCIIMEIIPPATNYNFSISFKQATSYTVFGPLAFKVETQNAWIISLIL